MFIHDCIQDLVVGKLSPYEDGLSSVEEPGERGESSAEDVHEESPRQAEKESVDNSEESLSVAE